MNSFENMPMIPQPLSLDVDLYPHQLASIYQMEEREKLQQVVQNNCVIETNMGINADDTGYGKTLAMVTLIMRDKMKWDMTTDYVSSVTTTKSCGKIKKTIFMENNKIGATLILMSQSIIKQWENEFKHAPSLNVAVLLSKKHVDTIKVEDFDVLLVTPSMYNKLVNKYYGMAWKRFIFDEPSSLKVPAMSEIVAGFYWFVTATPNSITFEHKKCKTSFMCRLFGEFSLFGFQHDYGYLIVKNDIEFIKQSFSMPLTHHEYHKCFNPVYKTVHGLVNNKITEMISAGNIIGAIRELGGRGTDNIAELVRKIKKKEIDDIDIKIDILNTRGSSSERINIWKERKERIEIQLNELDNRYKDILSGDCNICMEKLVDPVMEPNCQNIFCGACLLTWLKTKSSCPLCRNNIKNEKLIYIGNDLTIGVEEKVIPLKTKINVIIDIIKNKSEGKFIIFSAWNETFDPIRDILKQNQIGFVEIKGGVETREKSLVQFKTGKIQVIFLNSRFNGSGINLQETTDIIVYHEMSSDILNQILGRANRIGRTESLYVHHLVL